MGFSLSVPRAGFPGGGGACPGRGDGAQRNLREPRAAGWGRGSGYFYVGGGFRFSSGR